MSTLIGRGRNGIANVPSDAAVLPAQAFVDVMNSEVAWGLTHGMFSRNFSYPNKGITKFAAIFNYEIQQVQGSVPGLDLSGNALPTAEVDAIFNFADCSLGKASLTGTNADKLIDVSGGTSGDPTGGAASVHGWGASVGAEIAVKFNLHGYPVTVDAVGALYGFSDFRGSAMTSAEVNALLAFLVAHYGTDLGNAVRLDGVGMGAPTGQGVTDKATLNTNGPLVTTS